MDSDAGEIAFAQDLVKLGSPQSALDENDHLVELKRVKEIIEFAIFLAFAQLDIILLQSVEGQLGFIVDVDLEWVSHKLLADGSNLLRESGAEHHDLLLGRSGTEDFLNITAHVWASISEAELESRPKKSLPI